MVSLPPAAEFRSEFSRSPDVRTRRPVRTSIAKRDTPISHRLSEQDAAAPASDADCQLTDWSAADMQSPGDTSRHDQSRAVSQDQPSRAKLRRRSSSKRVLGVGVALCVPALGLGLAACGGTSSSAAATTSSAAATPASPSTGSTGSGGGSNVRSTNAAGGSLGEVTGVSGSSFTVSTQGVNVTVKETSSTVYDKGTSGAAASAVTKGTTVLVIGRVDNKTITATQVIVGPAINLSTASANVIAFRTPNESESKSVGQLPASYKQGPARSSVVPRRPRPPKRR
jgi:Domain of unknown function (DUF5666)